MNGLQLISALNWLQAVLLAVPAGMAMSGLPPSSARAHGPCR